MSTILILILIIIVLLLVIIVTAKICRKLQEDKSKLEIELSRQKSNAVYLVKHAEELAQIQKDEKVIENKIDGAKSDEEILNIINTIIDANNSRLCK